MTCTKMANDASNKPHKAHRQVRMVYAATICGPTLPHISIASKISFSI